MERSEREDADLPAQVGGRHRTTRMPDCELASEEMEGRDDTREWKVDDWLLLPGPDCFRYGDGFADTLGVAVYPGQTPPMATKANPVVVVSSKRIH